MGSFRLAAIKILRKSKEPLHYSEITNRAIDQNLIVTSGATPASTMNAQITTDIKFKKNKSAFIKNKPGIFSLNPKYSHDEEKKDEQIALLESDEQELETKNTQYIGKAGEHLVVSKLLFQEFNANIMSVDDGMDIAATKDNRLFNIQVKTANENNGKYIADMSIKSYNRHNRSNAFYILVLRGEQTNYLIIPYLEMQKNIDQKHVLVVGHGRRYRITIIAKDEKLFLGKLTNDVSYFKNKWELIR